MRPRHSPQPSITTAATSHCCCRPDALSWHAPQQQQGAQEAEAIGGCLPVHNLCHQPRRTHHTSAPVRLAPPAACIPATPAATIISCPPAVSPQACGAGKAQQRLQYGCTGTQQGGQV